MIRLYDYDCVCYALDNTDSSAAEETPAASTNVYPKNLTESNVLYYTLTPGLCYQLEETKRLERIRFDVITREFIEIIVWLEVAVNILEYVILPYMKDYEVVPGLYNSSNLSKQFRFVPLAVIIFEDCCLR